jgi:hypothetical protein
VALDDFTWIVEPRDLRIKQAHRSIAAVIQKIGEPLILQLHFTGNRMSRSEDDNLIYNWHRNPSLSARNRACLFV